MEDELLHFYVNFYSLNCITKKNCYPLLLISDLLSLLYKAQVYTKVMNHWSGL